MTRRNTSRRALRHALIGLSCIALGGIAVSGASASSENYTVCTLDTLSSIAKKFDTTVTQLTELNRLRNPDELTVGQVLAVPQKAPTETSYRVKKGDVLSSIARSHNVPTATLASYNRIADPNRLKVGDTILIPLGGASGWRPTLDPGLERSLDRIRVTGGRWKHVVIHHSATSKGTTKGMDRYHRDERHMQNGLAYHFVIGNGRGMPDGKIEMGNRWKQQLNGGHLASEWLNTQSIGICLVGDFEKERPTAKQLESLHALCAYLLERCSLPANAIQTHTQINTKPTRCPGRNFPTETFLRSAAAYDVRNRGATASAR